MKISINNILLRQRSDGGEIDPLGDVQTGIKKLERYHLDYRYFPNVGHAINQEIADEINDIVISSCIGDKMRV